MAILNQVSNVAMFLGRPIAYLFALIETLALRALHRPTSTGFRMFLPLEAVPRDTYPVAESHLISAVSLLLIPILVSWERRWSTVAHLSPAARLCEPWTLHHRRLAWVCMFVRVWFFIAVWNVAIVWSFDDENGNLGVLKGMVLKCISGLLLL
ncbi:hypothetical protein F5Y18DRAFT_442753 [Xylariaceae sp. FL1019]|nr:hypothetical protein F5Y18DRAFT_442753 [Xylariaceae sp. FL1019]